MYGPEALGRERKPEKVIPREEAAFWLDGQGRWRNVHGRFEHPRIARHFHACICSDEQGYYLFQEHPEHLEKVYFPYEDTALFVIDLKFEPLATLVLNTGQEMLLEPHGLFIQGDNLYVTSREHRIKFASRALIKLSRFLDFGVEPPVMRLPQGDFVIACAD